MNTTYLPVGFTKKTYGAKGELKVVIQDDYLEDFLSAEAIFMEVQGKPAPFFIEYVREGNDLLLKLEGVDSPEQAKAYTSRDLMLHIKDVNTPPPLLPGELKFGKYEGFMIWDEESGEVGLIEEVQEFPQQEMAIVRYQGKQVYIPLHDRLILDIDEARKKITLRLPEGLLSI